MRMARATSVFIGALLLAGCAGMSEADCRKADWYALGYNDARARITPQARILGRQCEGYGVKIDQARYEQGWREGSDKFLERMP
jgi:hypothetical protein